MFFQSSRAQILKQATDYIMFMSKKNSAHQQDIDDLKKQNQVLDQQGAFSVGSFCAVGPASFTRRRFHWLQC